MYKWLVFATSAAGIREKVGNIEGTEISRRDLEWLVRDHARLWGEEWAEWPIELVRVEGPPGA